MTDSVSIHAEAYREAPTLSGYPLLGVLPLFRRDPLGLWAKAAREHGDIVRMNFGPTVTYFINHPDYIQYVLQTHNRNYDRNTFGNSVIQLVSGLNLLTSDGDYWLGQRRLMQPAFHRQQITTFGRLMTSATSRMLEKWDRQYDSGAPVDAHVEMMRVTLDIVGQALFSVDLSSEASVLGWSFMESMAYVNYRLNHLFYFPRYVPTPRNLRLRKALRKIDEILYGMIEERRASGEQKDDLLAMLLAARYEDTGERMTDEQLLNEAGIIIGAGHETTANALTWSFYLLSQHPEAEARLHEELDTVLAGRQPSPADLHQLPYTRQVIEEAMRLYPPAWVLTGRRAIEDDLIDGYRIPAGSVVFISPYVIHRDARFWPEPDRFIPERFAPEMSAARPRFAYLPFGGGPRKCIGNDFAMTEAQLILAMVAQRYRLKLAAGYQAEPDPIFTLRVKGGLPMQLERRESRL